MGHLFSKSRGKSFDNGDLQLGVVPIGKVEGIHEEFTPDLLKWEAHQKRLSEESLKHMKDDFMNRPDLFLSNMLFLSPQFYANFEKEKDEINQLVRDKELEYNDELAPYKRRIQFVGAHEVASAQHTLYHPLGVRHYEHCGYRQVYVIQDNVQLYMKDEYDSLQDTEYYEVDGPSYRMCVEPSNRHNGYVRLRCADIIPGISRHNTYEDLYRHMQPMNEDDPDPFLDARPMRRSSKHDLAEDIEESGLEAPPNMSRLLKRRPSGEVPLGYLQDLRAGMKKVEERIEQTKKKNGVTQPSVGKSAKASGATAPKLNSGPLHKVDLNDKAFNVLRKKLAGIEEGDEDDEDEDDEEVQIKLNEIIDFPSSSDSSVTVDEENTKPDLQSTIKKECFINRKLRLKSATNAYEGLTISEENEKRTYLSSERYRQVFEDDFPEFLKVVKKSHLEGNTAVEGASILTEDNYNDSLMIKTEYIPGFNFRGWPQCADEWRFRSRKSKADPITKMTYRWPKPRHVDEIVDQHGVTVVPMGFYNPRDPNRIMLIEWQLQFVRAEQILLRSLGHQQVRVLLMVQLLFRDHVDKNNRRLLRPKILRYVLFWLCEHNYRDWQDDRLAMKIKAFLKTLYNALSEGELPHYFIRRVNLLKSIKEITLRTVQESVKRINENLPMHLMHTMTRLRTEEEFYPRLNIKEVYKLVKVAKYGLAQLNPILAAPAPPDEEEEFADLGSDDESDSEEHRRLKKQLHETRERRKSLFLEKTGKPKPNATTKKRNVDLNIKVRVLNDLRAERLLTLFARHFIELATWSNKFKAHAQAYRYLLYAVNMLDLLEDEDMKCSASGGDIEDIREEIQSERNVTRQGINVMLNTSHRLTDTLELKIAHVPKGPNWQLKKPTKENTPLPTPILKEPSSEPATSPKKDETGARTVVVQEPKTKSVKKVSKKEQEKSVSKSLSSLNEPSLVKSVTIADENDEVRKVVVQEPKTKSVKKLSKKEQEKSVSKSLSNLDEPSLVKSVTLADEKDKVRKVVVQEPKTKSVKKLSKKEQEKSVSKSMSNLDEPSLVKSMTLANENDKVIKFAVASDDEDESTDL